MMRRRASLLVICAVLACSMDLRAQDTAGLTNEDLIEGARTGNEQILMARVDAQRGNVDLQRARAMRGPSISGSLDFSYLSNPVDAIVIRAGELGSYVIGGSDTLLPPEDVRVYDGMEPTVFRLTGTLEQPVYTWGKLDLGVQLAEQSVLMREHQVSALELEIALGIARNATMARYLALMELVAGQQIDLAAELVRLTAVAVENGILVRTALLEAQVGEQQARLARQEIQNQRELSMVTLRQLSAMPGLTVHDLSHPLLVRSAGDGSSELEHLPELPQFRPIRELVDNAVADNPGISGLSQAVQVARTNLELAQAQDSWRPDFGLNVELSLVGPRFPLEPDWYGKDEFNLTASIGLQTTIYDSGLRDADAASAGLDLASAERQLADSMLTLESKVRELVLAAELARARLEYLHANAGLLEAQLNVSRREFDAGVGTRDGVVIRELAVRANELDILSELLTIEATSEALKLLAGT